MDLSLSPRIRAGLAAVALVIITWFGYWALDRSGEEPQFELGLIYLPVLATFVVLYFTKMLRLCGLENKWALRIIRYGLLIYFWRLPLMFLFIILLGSTIGFF